MKASSVHGSGRTDRSSERVRPGPGPEEAEEEEEEDEPKEGGSDLVKEWEERGVFLLLWRNICFGWRDLSSCFILIVVVVVVVVFVMFEPH